ncbi:hypothetical protein IAQ61_007007 [Plenodomus lingam]|uniref:Predicted protein n=1 Tax=Leptosphaeria maculans (strain JN3 / isolate v23.1.3 / race Av1-4-5-6-7-8) TaxID=985895 RepID=E5AD64_LEPMJ|nr:predicted protein [Plenodomus lingam JN3]KAH9869794.1 hypothetical protein IAQ61_007007 [Plenodomus lingam]CBY02416.1 predicted protein [Plenodomus lingam JN3]
MSLWSYGIVNHGKSVDLEPELTGLLRDRPTYHWYLQNQVRGQQLESSTHDVRLRIDSGTKRIITTNIVRMPESVSEGAPVRGLKDFIAGRPNTD